MSKAASRHIMYPKLENPMMTVKVVMYAILLARSKSRCLRWSIRDIEPVGLTMWTPTVVYKPVFLFPPDPDEDELPDPEEEPVGV